MGSALEERTFHQNAELTFSIVTDSSVLFWFNIYADDLSSAKAKLIAKAEEARYACVLFISIFFIFSIQTDLMSKWNWELNAISSLFILKKSQLTNPVCFPVF